MLQDHDLKRKVAKFGGHSVNSFEVVQLSSGMGGGGGGGVQRPLPA